MAYKAAIITLSDKGARGERQDGSGPVLRDMLTGAGYEVVSWQILSDDPEGLKAALISSSEASGEMKVTSIPILGSEVPSRLKVPP